MINILIIYGIIFGGVFVKNAHAKTLPVGTCIADRDLCNIEGSSLDPWEQRCFTSSVLKITAIGKRSYKTSCLEDIIHCKDFVSFKDVKSYYFVIECPTEIKQSKPHSSILLPKRQKS